MPRALLVGLGLLLAVPAESLADDDPPTPEVDAAPDPASMLQDAKEAYVLGDPDAARALLLRIVQRARRTLDVPTDVEHEALVYLGEIQYLAGDTRAAEGSFRLVLEANPAYRLSPYEHPMNVIGAFNIVRESVEEARAAARDERVPMPWWGYAPFGAPQFVQGRPVRGAVYATLQVGFAAGSIATWVVIDDAVAGIDTRPSPANLEEAQAQRQQAVLLRDAVSIPVAAAFYVTWGASVLDAGLSWRKDRLAPRALTVTPVEGGAHVAVHWKF